MRVQPFYLTGKLNSSRLFSTEDEFEGVRRLPFGLIDGVDVAVDGFKSGVTEAGGYVFYFGAVTQKQRCRSVAEGVGLKMPERRKSSYH